jgi:dephospho-CoA kinase
MHVGSCGARTQPVDGCNYCPDMARVLVTGMSGTGKSTALAELGRRGFRVVDMDSPAWSEWVPAPDRAVGEWIWREDRIANS